MPGKTIAVADAKARLAEADAAVRLKYDIVTAEQYRLARARQELDAALRVQQFAEAQVKIAERNARKTASTDDDRAPRQNGEGR
jgi:hypothetical protein